MRWWLDRKSDRSVWLTILAKVGRCRKSQSGLPPLLFSEFVDFGNRNNI